MDQIAFEQRTLESTAAILLNNIIATINNNDSTKEDFIYALKPFAIIQWTRPIIEKLGIEKINRVFGRLKRAPVPKDTLRLMIDHFKNALSDQGSDMPVEYTEWETILTKYSLNLQADFSTWTSVIHLLNTLQQPTPAGLSELTLDGITGLTEASPYQELICPLWQAVRYEFAPSKGITPLTLKFRTDSFSLTEALKAKSVEDSEFGREFALAQGDLDLPENFCRLGPKARVMALQNIMPDSQKLLRFYRSAHRITSWSRCDPPFRQWLRGWVVTSPFALYWQSLLSHQPLTPWQGGALCFPLGKHTQYI